MSNNSLSKRAFLAGCGCAVCAPIVGKPTSVFAQQDGDTAEVIACAPLMPEADGAEALAAAEAELALEHEGIVSTSSEEAAALRIHPKWGRWNPKRGDPDNPKPLRVGFVQPNHSMVDTVITAGKDWQEHMGLSFDFEATDRLDILVQFDSAGNNSYMGAASRAKAREGRPTLRLQKFPLFTSRRVKLGSARLVLGHALGLIHEHQNPEADLEFDEDAVIAYYKEKLGWKAEKTRLNVLKDYSAQIDDATSFDAKSIMMYALPQGLVQNYTTAFSKNYVISDLDKELIGRIYPKLT